MPMALIFILDVLYAEECGCNHDRSKRTRTYSKKRVWQAKEYLVVAVQQDATGKALDMALAYALGIGGAEQEFWRQPSVLRLRQTFFGEQAVLCGGVCALMQAGFETLCEAGYDPRNAYFECIHEMKLIVDLIYQSGFAGMRYSISNTAGAVVIILQDQRSSLKTRKRQ